MIFSKRQNGKKLIPFSLSSTGMAGDTVIAEIIDFFMFFLHFRRRVLMTTIASIGVVVIVGMAQLALLVCPTVVQWE